MIKEMSLEGQFFIITPKLVEGLAFPETALSSMIYSSEGVPEGFSAYVSSMLK